MCTLLTVENKFSNNLIYFEAFRASVALILNKHFAEILQTAFKLHFA